MSSSMYTTAEGVLVVTHVHPFPHGAPQGAGLPHCVGVQKFSKNHPTVLGTIQIMVGLIVLLFGIAMAIPADTIAAFSGLWVWGTLVYITAGSLTVAAGRYLTRSLGRMAGFSGVLAIANLLELIVSIVVAGIACNATCNCSGEPRSVIVIPAALGLPEVPAAAPPVSQVQNNSKDSQQPRATGEPEPPTYDSVIS
ncbi:membrane-spanning 4-domains subfamily A member 15-like isoform X2 [Hippoglossus hippoglossus]|uniref:membrane-spanning 4-domains subfamily A member 15-like isoform X2 n=1 Tax=Hippoglossus hippoglossus TaxID=8267 RepID=UPI00148CFBDF|nr:membrane-spanning 4-domains subfamily A member 15-like isoform X2 [Hippoglossus hippoglossus]